MGKLDGKIALVTGGSQGLGKGIVEAFLLEGAKVAFCGRNMEKLKAVEAHFKTLGDIYAIQCDVSDSSDVKKMFAQIAAHYGTLDILVNNAGKTGGRDLPNNDRENYFKLKENGCEKFSLEITKNMTDREWDESIKINLYGTFYCTREALKIMEQKKYGKIINVVSTGGIDNTSPHSPNYVAAKGGVVAFTKNLAVEVIGAGVIVNAIAPGAIMSEGYERVLASTGDDFKNRLLKAIPAGRLGTVQEHASLVVYLASDEANYIVGQIIAANGGVC